MSLTCHELLCLDESCHDDNNVIIVAEAEDSLEFNETMSIKGFLEEEQRSSVSVSDAVSVASSSRSHSVSWILKVRAFYGFEALTAYLAVNYLDRFLSAHRLPENEGWPIQLLSVACLSLAAKMEEPLVPCLLDLQVEGAKYIFEPKTIQRMELLVLSVLDWRLRLVTPFAFISFFSYKLDASGTHTGLLIARSTDIILTNIQEASYLEYKPSNIAAAAMLCAASELPSFSFVTPDLAQSWCDGLCKDKVKDCYKLMQQFVKDHSKRKCIKAIPQFRVSTQITRVKSYIDSPSSSSSSSSSPFSYNLKKRKLNNKSWVDYDF